MTIKGTDDSAFREAASHHLNRGAITVASVDNWRSRWEADPVQTAADMRELSGFSDIAAQNAADVGDQAEFDAAVAQITHDAQRP